MHAIWMMKQGGVESLKLRETPDPTPSDDELKILVRATGINFSDILARMGLYSPAPKPPCILGYEASGVVDTVGANVKGFSKGDRVVAMTSFGGHSDMICVPSNFVVKLPDNVSFETAAALPLNYLTAHYMLTRTAGVRPGETVLVHMAAGGVGIALLQLCNIIGGVRVIGTASASKHGILRQNGCDFPIDYRTTDYASEVDRITDGKGVDVVFDPLGGGDWKRGYKLLRTGGRLVVYGFTNLHKGKKRNMIHILMQLAAMPWFTPLKLLGENRTISGVTLSEIWGGPLNDDLKDLVMLCEEGKLKPIVDSVYPFAQAGEAYLRIEQRKNVGKIVMIPDGVSTAHAR